MSEYFTLPETVPCPSQLQAKELSVQAKARIKISNTFLCCRGVIAFVCCRIAWSSANVLRLGAVRFSS
jgi:hypothetical protein